MTQQSNRLPLALLSVYAVCWTALAVAPRYREYDGAWDTRRTARFGLFGRLLPNEPW